MIEDLKSAKKDELEYQDISILIALLPFLVNQDSIFNAEDNFHNKQRRIVCLNKETID